MSLAKMLAAGFPVPDGFHITTDAYRQLIVENELQPKILASLRLVDVSVPRTLEVASHAIHELFKHSRIPVDVSAVIVDAYHALTDDHAAVAVRSSATAEDLPGASFAGQQETYLNIRGVDELLGAVQKCWASLWTAQAIAYRIKNNIDQKTVALAVVVQKMVNAEASGILFTANPINGRRDETVINAAWGLGQAIVGGLVSPDTIVVDKATGQIKKVDVAEKTIITVLTQSGTTEVPLDDARRRSPVLQAAEVARLVDITHKIEDFYGRPQDIEWCYAKGDFYIVQSRPITALPETPIEWIPPNPKGVYMRASVVDLMPKPLSPLFVTMGIPAQVAQMQPLGRRLTGSNPVLHADYYTSINNYAYMNAAFPLKSWWWILTGLAPMFFRTFGKLDRLWRDQLHPEYQAFVNSKHDTAPENLSINELWREAQEIVNASAYYVTGLLFATMGASSGAELLLTSVYNKMVRQEGDPDAATLLMGWDNIPVHAEKSLYDLAMWCREHTELAEYVLATPSDRLAEQLKKGSGHSSLRAADWNTLRKRFNEHLQKFGHIIFQLDFAEPLPLDNPAPMLENIKIYLRGEGVDPHKRQKASEKKRIETGQIMLRRLKGFRRWAFTNALKYGQSMAAIREDALAEIGLSYPLLRRILYELGVRFAEAGVIEQPADIYLLEKKEIDSLVTGAELRLGGLVTERKAFWDRLRRETPPPMMPMKKKYMGINTSVWLAESETNQTSSTLKGIPTSAGRITAPACILLGPEDFHKMRRGDVLVASTTTPAWTPFFTMASAVVTDIGGPLSHGSIVAREYGIPAVMGTGIATRRIRSGQMITVDGTKGEVILETIQPGPIDWTRPHPKGMYARGSLCEHLPNPASPLFGTLGLRMVNIATKDIGELALGVGGGGYQYHTINGYVYLGMILTWREWLAMAKASAQLTRSMFKVSHEHWLAGRKEFFAAIARQDEKDVQTLSAVALLDSACDLMMAIGKFYTVIQASALPAATGSEIVFARVYKLISRKEDPKAETLLFGLETEPLRAEKSLFDLGMWIRAHPRLSNFVLHATTDELAAALQSASAAEVIPDGVELRNRFDQYMAEFGHTSYEFDFVKPTPLETPEVILEALKLYVEGKANNPYARQQEVARQRQETLIKIHSRRKLVPNRWFDKALNWAARVGPDREDSIADLGRGHATLRRLLGELGRRFATGGAIANAEDIYWLIETEVIELAALLERGENLPDYSARVPARKAAWREQLKLVPPAMLPEKSFWAKMLPWNRNATSDVLTGVACSAGKVTATARLLFGPEDFGKMRPGDVLVTVSTTPAWTPLFTLASAIVTDLGGPLSHSSIVAREYGIPAVLSTGMATRRIRDGQTVTVDGSAGTVTLD